jgi:hypothetical protein
MPEGNPRKTTPRRSTHTPAVGPRTRLHRAVRGWGQVALAQQSSARQLRSAQLERVDGTGSLAALVQRAAGWEVSLGVRVGEHPPCSGTPHGPVPLGPAGIPADDVYDQLLQQSYALRLRCAATRHQAITQRNVSVQLRGATGQLRMRCVQALCAEKGGAGAPGRRQDTRACQDALQAMSCPPHVLEAAGPEWKAQRHA